MHCIIQIVSLEKVRQKILREAKFGPNYSDSESRSLMKLFLILANFQWDGGYEFPNLQVHFQSQLVENLYIFIRSISEILLEHQQR